VAVTVIETVGGASANSFVSVAEADAYLEARLNSSAWTGTEPKKIALIEATREFNRLDWRGDRVTTTQALVWPRLYVEKIDPAPGDTWYLETEIPTPIKEATIELALEFLRMGTTDLPARSATDGVIEEKIGPMTTKWADPSQLIEGLRRFPRVWERIEPLLAAGRASSIQFAMRRG
jgi:hypothetical protein